ncbi:hypothetical protein RB595_005274 [Gaeumannomyces hyphopodioides]
MEANPPFRPGPRLQRRVEYDVPAPGIIALLVIGGLVAVLACAYGYTKLGRDVERMQRAREEQRATRQAHREHARAERRQQRARARQGQHAGPNAGAGPSSAPEPPHVPRFFTAVPAGDDDEQRPVIIVAEPPPAHRRRRHREDPADLEIEMESQAGPSRGRSHARSPRSGSH